MPRQNANTITEFLGTADATVIDPTNLPDSVSPDAANVRPIHGAIEGRGGHRTTNDICWYQEIREIIFVVLNGIQYNFLFMGGGDVWEEILNVVLYAQIPVDEDDDTLLPHFQLDDTSDCSSPYVDNESKDDVNHWEYRNVTGGGAWLALPAAGVPASVMSDIRNNGTIYHVHYRVPPLTTGLARGTNYMRLRWYQPRYSQYSAYTSIKTVYL